MGFANIDPSQLRDLLAEICCNHRKKEGMGCEPDERDFKLVDDILAEIKAFKEREMLRQYNHYVVTA